MNSIIKKASYFLLDIIQSIVLAFALFVISYQFFFQPEKVIGTSMYPSLKNSEWLIAEKVSYRIGIPKRGDIVVIKAPSTEPCSVDGCDYVKRIIGLPGEKIKIDNGFVYINGELLIESYLPLGTITSGGIFLKEKMTITINSDQYLVMGDNRSFSHDGRDFGPITEEAIVGKIFK